MMKKSEGLREKRIQAPGFSQLSRKNQMINTISLNFMATHLRAAARVMNLRMIVSRVFGEQQLHADIMEHSRQLRLFDVHVRERLCQTTCRHPGDP